MTQTKKLQSALEELKAKEEDRVRVAVEDLWSLLLSDDDIGKAVPFLVKNQAKLGGFTDSNQVVAGYYIKNKKYKELEEWLADTDPKNVANAYRGLFSAHTQGIDARAFLDRPGMMDKLKEIAAANPRLMAPEDYEQNK